jgi:hypothetical protein
MRDCKSITQGWANSTDYSINDVKSMKPFLKRLARAGGVAQVVEHLADSKILSNNTKNPPQ